jgi:hypothetical protein
MPKKKAKAVGPVEPRPYACWYKIELELPVLVAALSGRQAKAQVIEVLAAVATALGVASGTAFRIGRPRVKGTEKGPRLTPD